MPIVWEQAASREINDSESPSARTFWIVSGASDYANARAALDAVLPTSFGFPSSRLAYLDSVEALELRDDELWKFTIGYKSEPTPTFNDTEYEFEVAAPTERIFQALATTAYAPTGKSAPNFGGAVGVIDGQPQGLDQLTPFSSFTITKHWPVASVTSAYQMAVEAEVGKVNSVTYQGRAAGTLRFLGARGHRNGDKFPISYQFGFRPNVGSKTYDGITVSSQQGWQLLDPLYYHLPDSSAKFNAYRLRAIYVHTVYETSTFSALNL